MVYLKKIAISLIIALLLAIPLSYFFFAEGKEIALFAGDKLGYYSEVKFLEDEKGVPYVDVGWHKGKFIGKVYVPVAVAQTALEKYYPENDYQKFLASADWLVENAVERNGTFVWPYSYALNSYGCTEGHLSGMAQAQGAETLALAGELTGNKNYLEIARGALEVLDIPYSEGGVKELNNWYEEWACPTQPRSLNGHTHVLLALWNYWQITGDEKAKDLFDAGVVELEKDLPAYDTQGYSTYDALGKPASSHYHQVHIEHLNKLYELIGSPVLKDYADKFQSYQDNPFNLGKIGRWEIVVYCMFAGGLFGFFILVLILRKLLHKTLKEI